MQRIEMTWETVAPAWAILRQSTEFKFLQCPNCGHVDVVRKKKRKAS
jgi:predicted RNA-binding Zn-ribbon protein involved in translation (DUF1610 family)